MVGREHRHRATLVHVQVQDPGQVACAQGSSVFKADNSLQKSRDFELIKANTTQEIFYSSLIEVTLPRDQTKCK